jgi:hypothetical protein
VKQHVYNVAAGVVGIPFPSLFTYSGVMRPHAPARIVAGAVALGLALVGARRRPRVAIPLLGLWLANALLCFYIYRSRNQLIGAVGIYASAGIGLAELVPLLGRVRPSRYAAVAGAVLALAWLGLNASAIRSKLDSIRRSELTGSPCAALLERPHDVSAEIVARLARRYRLPTAPCGASR